MNPLTLIALTLLLLTLLLKSLYTHLSQRRHSSRTSSSSHPHHSRSSPSSRSSSPSPSHLEEKEIPIEDTPPYIFPPLAPKTAGKTSMGLKRLEMRNWLVVDGGYGGEHEVRKSLLEGERYGDVIQVLDGSQDACLEVLELVVEFLTSRYPKYFTISSSSSSSSPSSSPSSSSPSQRIINNHLTGESFLLDGEASTNPNPNPLEIAARLAMEDFNILIRNDEGEHCLMASATLFPAGWKLKERIGMSVGGLHGPVPGWKKNLGGSVERYFTHLSPRTSMERTNLFLQTTPHLFLDTPETHSPTTTPNDLWVRRERQTFRRLEKTGAVLFTVRTYMRPLTQIKGEEEQGLRMQIEGMEEGVRRYKGGEVWGDAWGAWCRGRDEVVEG